MTTPKKAHRIPFSFDHYDDVIGFVVSQAAYQLARTLSRAIAEVGIEITPREFAVINRLHQHGQLSQSELAEMTYKDKPAVTRMLDRLIAQGLVKKLPCSADRRVFQVSLTAEGEAVRERIVPLCVDMLESACKGIRREDLLTTVATLKKLTAQIQ
jgi:DNA-binding MarR family transcriptional regulator